MNQQGSSAQVRPQARVHFVCAGRMVTVVEGRAAGAIARCPRCGDATVLPPRVADGPACRAFQIQCGRVVG